MNAAHHEAILQYMRAHQADMARDLIRLCRVPSVRSAAETDMPFGRECDNALREAAALYRENGFEVTEHNASGYILAHFGAGEKNIGLFAHVDVVPVNEADWLLTRPFDTIERDGFLIGRGVNDDKSGAIAALYLLKAVRALNLPLESRVTVFMGANEESGMADLRAYAREQPLPDASLVPDGGFPVSLGERGILRLDISLDAPLSDVLSLNGGEAYNTVMAELTARVKKSDALVSELNARPQPWLSVTDEGDTLRLDVKGVASHAANPHRGDSALRRLCTLLEECGGLSAHDRGVLSAVTLALSDTNGAALGVADHDDVLGDLTVANGIARTENGRFMFTLDIRHGEHVSGAEITAKLREWFGARGFSIGIHGDSSAFTIPEAHPLAQALLETFRAASGNPDARPYYMGGGTYCKYLPNAFTIGTTMGGDARALNLPAGHGECHAPDEYLCIDGFVRASAMIAAMTLALDEALRGI